MADMDLGKKIGPLPLGAWVGIVAAGFGLSWYMSRGAVKSDQATEDDTTGGLSPDETVGVGGGQFIYTPPGTAELPTEEITTNDEWAVKATNYLISRGYDPASADQAIRLYIAAEKLNTAQWAMVTQALAYLGAPPQPLPPGPALPQPPTTPPAPSTPATPTISTSGIPSEVRLPRRGHPSYVATVKITRAGKPARYVVLRIQWKHRASDAWRSYKILPVGYTGSVRVRLTHPVRGWVYWRFTTPGGKELIKQVKTIGT